MRIKFTRQQLEAMAADPWLTDREKLVFDLYYRRGWEIERIAAEIDRNRSTVNRILRSIRYKTDSQMTPE